MAQHDGPKLTSPSYRFEVNAEANYPIQDLSYRIDLNDEALALVYNHLCFSGIAAVMAKAGEIFSEYQLTGDLPRLKEQQAEMLASIGISDVDV